MKTYTLLIIAFFCAKYSVGQVDTASGMYIENYSCGIQGVGTGCFFPLGQAKEKINHGQCFSPGIILSLKKFHYEFYCSVITGTIKNEFDNKQEYRAGRSLTAVSYELTTGYEVVQNKTMKIIPMVGTGFITYELVNPNSIIPFDKTASYWMYSFRVAIDFNVLRVYTSKVERNSVFIRFMSGYSPSIYRKSFDITGGAVFASITLGMKHTALEP